MSNREGVAWVVVVMLVAWIIYSIEARQDLAINQIGAAVQQMQQRKE